MLKFEESINLNQISQTGARAIAIIGLLAIAPRTFKEIKDALIHSRLFDENSSDDILRIDMNSIKAVGCMVGRASKSTNYKYVMEKHPFGLQLTIEDYKLIKRIYDKTKESFDINTLINYDKLFKKIASNIYDDDLKEVFLGISVLKIYDVNMIRDLLVDCENETTLRLEYKKQTSDTTSFKEITANKLILNNYKIYLYGYDNNKKDFVVLNCKNIKSIINRKYSDKTVKPKFTTVKFRLYDSENWVLGENEKILKSEKNYFLVEGCYINEFFAIQRILSFGDKCVVEEPSDFRDKIISKLKDMRKIYEI